MTTLTCLKTSEFGATISASNSGRDIRKDSKEVLSTVSPYFSQENVVPHKRLNSRKKSFETPKTSNEKFLARREHEYNIIRSHKNTHSCYKQLAVFVKYQDGEKYLAALVDFHRKGKKLFGGSLKPVFWFDVSLTGKRTFNGAINVGDTLPESVMRDMLGIHDKTVHIYAQSLDSISAPRKPAQQLRYEHIPAPRYRACGNVR